MIYDSQKRLVQQKSKLDATLLNGTDMRYRVVEKKNLPHSFTWSQLLSLNIFQIFLCILEHLAAWR